MDKLARGVASDFKAFFDLYEQQLQPGVQPRLLFITCVDSRLDPAAMMGTTPGEMFVLRIPGGMVPAQGLGDVMVMGAIELTLSTPSVKHIVVCGHTDCVFLQRVGEAVTNFELSGLSRLISLVDFARSQAITKVDQTKDPSGFQHALLEALIQRNLQALREIPLVKKREAGGELELHGWYFNMITGELFIYDEAKQVFEVMQVEGSASQPVSEPTPKPTATSVVAPTVPQTAAHNAPMTPEPSLSSEMTTSQPIAAPLTPPPVAPLESVVQPSVVTAPSVTPPLAPPPPLSAPPITVPRPVVTASEPLPVPSVAPTPVRVPSAEPIQRVYASEVVSETERASEQVSTTVKSETAIIQDELRTMFEAISSPLQRNRLRRRLNQFGSATEWEALTGVLKEFNMPLVRQTLREISVELSNGEVRTKLRQIVNQAESNGSSTNEWMQQLQKDFSEILQSLGGKT